MMGTAEKEPKSLILAIADMARSNPPMRGSFVAELGLTLEQLVQIARIVEQPRMPD